ncbi:MFS general substrate transporter [Acaromyces ingoldii]|uniref:MFS general substrate transporter n=1 Tax=Acaromyces ingoldii TaxID=215250 RepID=A0A316YUH3_9BASI|nr:MFS general substrate transporter [Acaromyces ingoldii]PWN92706.1 MFS general substrate transporter [Acaromyces ingoldii]
MSFPDTLPAMEPLGTGSTPTNSSALPLAGASPASSSFEELQTPPDSAKKGHRQDVDGGIAVQMPYLYSEREKDAWLEDPEMPFNWDKQIKWRVAAWLFLFTVAVNMNGAGFAPVASAAAADLKTTRQVLLVGNALYFIAQGIAPLVLAPLSESRGRVVIYSISGAMFALFYLPQALAHNAETWIVTRFIQGCAGSVVEANIGGSLADMFPPSQRGTILSVYVAIGYVGTGIGPVISAAVLPIGWRWQAWLGMIVASFTAVGLLVFGKETRSSTLYARRQRRKAAAHAEKDPLDKPEVMKAWYVETLTSLSRPSLYLVAEPIVTCFSIWIGFTFGCIYLIVESAGIVYSSPPTQTAGYPPSFEYGYGWSNLASSAVLLAYVAGAGIGFLASLHQEHLYQRAAQRHAGRTVPPEARLYWSAVAGLVFSVACLWYAWSGRTSIHPAVSVIGLSFVVAAVYPIHYASFAYLSDAYEEYASSALASQTLIRTITAGCFPLFTDQMYRGLTPPVASSVLAAIALVLAVFPFVLLRWGPEIRKKSKRAVRFLDE